jgi:chromosome segregation ATPase
LEIDHRKARSLILDLTDSYVGLRTTSQSPRQHSTQ